MRVLAVSSSRTASIELSIAVLAVAAAAPLAALAQSLDSLLGTQEWRLDYDVTVAGSASRPYRSVDGASGEVTATGTITTSIESAMTASMLLGLRQDGPDYVFNMSALPVPEPGAVPSVADALAAAEAMMAALEGTAYWQSTGPPIPESADDPDASAEDITATMLSAMRATASPARLVYEQVMAGDHMDETGEWFKHQSRVVATGDGDVVVGGNLGDARFQLEAKTGQFRLGLPLSYRGDFTGEKIEIVETNSLLATPNVRDLDFNSSFAQVTVDNGSQTLVIVADAAVAGGKISGEGSFPVHFADQLPGAEPIPATLTVRYTLTPQP